MNRLYILTLSIIICTAISEVNGQVRFGIKVDPQLSWFNPASDVLVQESSRLGVDIGLVVDSYFSENYAFTTGVSIHVTGSTVSFNEDVTLTLSDEAQFLPKDAELTYKLQYISVPLGLKLKTREFGYFTYFGQLGVTPEINIKSQAQSDYNAINNLNASDEINLFHLSYHAGVGVEYSLGGSTSIVSGIYYHNGFTDITEYPDDKATMNMVKLRLGVMF